MATGIDLMRKVRTQKAHLRSEHDREAGVLRAAQNAVERTRSSLYQTIEELARTQVISLADGDLDIWFSARDALQQALRRRDEKYAYTLEEIEGAQSGIREREAEVEKAEAELIRAEKHLRSVESGVMRAVEASPIIQAARLELKEAREKAGRAKEKWDASVAERDEKLQPYLSDPLFSYLLATGYATPQYGGRGLTRMMDGWVAKLCSFGDALQNYRVLTQLPEFLGRHAARMAETVAGPQEIIDAEFDRIEADQNEPAALQAVQDARDRMRRAGERLESLNQRIDSLIAEKEAFSNWSDPSFIAAKRSMSEVLTRASLSDLEDLARATETTHDDVLVERIGELRRQLQAAEADLSSASAAVEKRNQAVRRVEDLERRARSKGWDSSDYKVRSSGLDDLLTGYVLGSLTSSDAWGRLERSVTHDPPPAPRSSYSGSDWSPSGGSIGGGGWSTSDSIGGGGWSTTDET